VVLFNLSTNMVKLKEIVPKALLTTK